MANTEHVNLIHKGAEYWNGWWGECQKVDADLSGANLRGLNLQEIDLHGANLRQADLSGSHLSYADLSHADLAYAKLRKAWLSQANLSFANLFYSDFSESCCTAVQLYGALIVCTNFENANLSEAYVFASSAWDVRLAGAIQRDIVITPASLTSHQPQLTVDNLEVAQFIYLLINNEKVRSIIDAVTSKVVLILGRFTTERKKVLDAIREDLRRRDLTPVLFDFDKPASKDVTGTVETLARMARFVIADITDPSSIPHELATLVPHLRTTPVLPIRLAGASGYTMFSDYQRAYAWVLDTYEYRILTHSFQHYQR